MVCRPYAHLREDPAGVLELGLNLSLASGNRRLAFGHFREAPFLERKRRIGDIVAAHINEPTNRLAGLIDALGVVGSNTEFLGLADCRE